MKKTILFLALCPMMLFGQFTLIPDTAFERKLIDIGLDSGALDGSVPTANIDTITFLKVSGANNLPGDITDLTGIADFLALTELQCAFNDITFLDLSNNALLTHLDCGYNYITAVDLSNNTSISTLICNDNNISNLDLSSVPLLDTLNCRRNWMNDLDVGQNPLLSYLACGSQLNQSNFTNLDVSNNPALSFLWCSYTDLTSLDLSNNPQLSSLICNTNDLTQLNLRNGNNLNFSMLTAAVNPNLNCVTVDDTVWANANWNLGQVDTGVVFSENCLVTSIQEESEATILIYPNPSNGIFQIELLRSVTGSVSVFNLMGKEVLNKALDGNSVSIDLLSFKQGTYILKIMEGNGKMIDRRTIVLF